MLTKLLWTALAATMTSLAAGLAYRGSVELWRALRHEDPPDPPGWAKFLVGKRVHHSLMGRLHASESI